MQVERVGGGPSRPVQHCHFPDQVTARMDCQQNLRPDRRVHQHLDNSGQLQNRVIAGITELQKIRLGEEFPFMPEQSS